MTDMHMVPLGQEQIGRIGQHSVVHEKDLTPFETGGVAELSRCFRRLLSQMSMAYPMDGNYQQWGPFWLSGSMLELSKGEGQRIYRYH